MLYQKKTINNVPTKIPLSNSAPVGNPIGTNISTYKKIQPRNYLYCDGSTFDETLYPALYLYLGTNVLPDYRECAIVGAEKNTTDVFDSTETDPSTGLPGTQNHDVYTQGQFKDDQVQQHNHRNPYTNQIVSSGYTRAGYATTTTLAGTNEVSGNIATGRAGDVTRGKRKAVYYYIKAVDGVDISDEDTFLNTVKNYVNEKNSYSTDEILTGGTWIDGKPIYRKVITIDFSSNVSYTRAVSAEAGNSTYQVVNTSNSVIVGSFGTRQPWQDTKAGNIKTTVYMSGGNVLFITEHQAGTVYLVCEYTKETD